MRPLRVAAAIKPIGREKAQKLGGGVEQEGCSGVGRFSSSATSVTLAVNSGRFGTAFGRFSSGIGRNRPAFAR
ncbi:MAG: hypothetical protein ACKPB0_01660, partial [Opitutaceae bacterium]